MHCQSNKLRSFTVWQEFGKIAQRSYSYSTCLLYEQGSRKPFLITVAGEENMSHTSLYCNVTQNSHTQPHRAGTIKTVMLFFMLWVTYQALNNLSFLHFSGIQCLQRGGCILLLWLKWNYSCILFERTFNYWCCHGWTVETACVQTQGTLVVMTHGMQDTYIVHEECTNIGKQVV